MRSSSFWDQPVFFASAYSKLKVKEDLDTRTKIEINFEDFLLICTALPHFGPFSGGRVKSNFADKNFMDTQTFLKLKESPESL